MGNRAGYQEGEMMVCNEKINHTLLRYHTARPDRRVLTKSATLAGTACFVVAISLVMTHPVSAQLVDEPDPPPSIETRSPGDVDMGSGSYSMETVDLQIGSGQFPGGLTLERSYNSSSDRYFSTRSGYSSQGWSHNWVMHMTASQMRSAVADGLPDPINPDGGALLGYQADWYHSIVASNVSAKFSNDQVVDFRYLPRIAPRPIPPHLQGVAGATHIPVIFDPIHNRSWTGLNFPGVYRPIEEHNRSQKLEFVGSVTDPLYHASGHYEFTNTDGTHYTFHPGLTARMSHVTAPNGTVATVHYGINALSHRPIAVTTSNGYAILFEYQAPASIFRTHQIVKACVVNLATTHVAPGDLCPVDTLSVSYGHTEITVTRPPFPNRPTRNFTINALTSATDALGQTTVYEYDDRQHVNCVKDAGESQCRIEIDYNRCSYTPQLQEDPQAIEPDILPSEQVMEQRLATGEVLTYSTSASHYCPSSEENPIGSYTDSQGNKTSLQMAGGKPLSITDPLGRKTDATYTTLGNPYEARGTGLLTSQTLPDGNRVELSYNDRGLVTERRSIPKPGSGEPTLVTTTIYPADCTPTTRKTCNKPVRSTDASGNVTDYEYAAEHGGVTRVLGPVVGGVRPETRYVYGQNMHG